MLRASSAIALLFAFYGSAQAPEAQTQCFSMTLQSQEAIDAFDCTVVNGTLQIVEGNGLHIYNLEGLSGLQRVAGSLRIKRLFDVVSLSGLEALTEVGGTFEILDMNGVTDFVPLSSLVSVGTDLRIVSNDNLVDLTGLGAVESVGGDLIVGDNFVMERLSGLAPLTAVEGVFDIYRNPSLVDISVLSSLSLSGLSISGNLTLSTLFEYEQDQNLSYLEIGYNPMLESLEGLNSVGFVDGVFEFRGNDAISSLFQGSGSISALSMDISDNAQLENLDGLDPIPGGVDSGGANIVIIESNPLLVDLSALADATFPNWVVQDNASLTSLGGLGSALVEARFVAIRDNASLSDLDGLASLTSVTRLLEISNNASLSDLGDLASLTSVAGLLEISNNASLTTLDGLASLSSVEDIQILDNASLADIDGLSQLTTILPNGGLVLVKGNPMIVNVDGLASLEANGWSILIQDNASLTDLSGLSGLRSIRYLDITDNASLTGLEGLESLSSVNGFVFIRGNAALLDVDGLNGLETVDRLFITDNATLANLDGLSGIGLVVDRMEVSENPQLSNCSCGLYGLIQNGAVNNGLTVENNAPGCNSISEVTEPAAGSCPFVVDADDAPEAGALALTVGPNPAAGALALRFALATPGPARLAVYDVRGRRVATLLDGDAAGETAATLDVSDWAPGVYVARLDAPDRAETVTFTVAR